MFAENEKWNNLLPGHDNNCISAAASMYTSVEITMNSWLWRLVSLKTFQTVSVTCCTGDLKMYSFPSYKFNEKNGVILFRFLHSQRIFERTSLVTLFTFERFLNLHISLCLELVNYYQVSRSVIIIQTCNSFIIIYYRP